MSNLNKANAKSLVENIWGYVYHQIEKGKAMDKEDQQKVNEHHEKTKKYMNGILTFFPE